MKCRTSKWAGVPWISDWLIVTLPSVFELAGMVSVAETYSIDPLWSLAVAIILILFVLGLVAWDDVRSRGELQALVAQSAVAVLRRTAKIFAVRQVIPSLLPWALSLFGQKAICFGQRVWMRIPADHFADAIGVGPKFMNNVGVADALQLHHPDCNSLDKCELASFFDNNVHFDTCNRVSFRMGFFPEQISHVVSRFSYMVGRIASMGISGFAPAILYGRNFHKGAVSLVGVAIRSCHPGAGQDDEEINSRQYLNCKPDGVYRSQLCDLSAGKRLKLLKYISKLPSVTRAIRVLKSSLDYENISEVIPAKFRHFCQITPHCENGRIGRSFHTGAWA